LMADGDFHPPWGTRDNLTGCLRPRTA
jgi:hypothetical protein